MQRNCFDFLRVLGVIAHRYRLQQVQCLLNLSKQSLVKISISSQIDPDPSFEKVAYVSAVDWLRTLGSGKLMRTFAPERT